MTQIPFESTEEYIAVSPANIASQYEPPVDFGVPNPLGPRLHNWKGGPLNEGSLFHGPLYTRPAYNLPRISRPLFGVEGEGEISLGKTLLLGGVCFVLAYVGSNLIFGKG